MKFPFAPLAAAVLCSAALSPHPAFAQTQPALPVTLQLQDGRPTIFQGTPSGGRRAVPSTAYCNSIVGWGDPAHKTRWTTWTDYFIGSGVKVFHLEMGRYKGEYGKSSFWTDEDQYPADAPKDEPYTLDERAQYILSKVPDARFIIRLGAYAPAAWVQKNPGEMQTNSAGKLFEPSLASEKYLKGVREYYVHAVRYYESRAWSNHVLGYMVIPLGEGLTPLATEANFYDRSAAMQSAWRGYVQKKYAGDKQLQDAWGQPEARLATAEIPRDEDLRKKIATLPHWPAASAMRLERDYASLQRELFERWVRTLTGAIDEAATRPVLIGIDSMKQPLLGWQIDEAFGGTGAGTNSFSLSLASGSIDVGPILDGLPWLTNLITPADYTARSLGFGFEAEGLGDSLLLRGKTTFVENDARTYLFPEGPDNTPVLGTFMNNDEVHAGLLRNTGMALSRGFLTYWTDISGKGYYQDEKIQQQIRLDRSVQERGSLQPHRETPHAIAVIIDDGSPLYESFSSGFQNLALLRQRVDSLESCGIPYRLYLLSDLEKANFPKYHCYLFPNLFKVDDATIALLKRKVLRDGNMVIFGPGTGITDGETVSAAGAEKLLGIPMKLYDATSARRVRVRTGSHPALAAIDMPRVFGDSYSYGPILAPDPARIAASGATVLGAAITTWKVNAPGLVLKDFGLGGSGNGKGGARGPGDYAAVFSTAIPLPGPLLRSLARYGGCNVWVEGDAVVMASDSVVSLHSTEPGPFTLNLPRRVHTVVDAETGKTVARDTTSLRVRMTPPQTKIFFLD